MKDYIKSSWIDGVSTSGFSYLVHRYQHDTLSEGTADEVSLYSSRCGSASTKAIDIDPELLNISKRCKRCFK